MGCDDWCAGDLFVKVESNLTVMKNLSSWAMKCTWTHCSSCSDCSDMSTLIAEHTKNDVAAKLSSASTQPSCDDWCSSEVFTAVNQNQTSSKTFTWDMKCEWPHCGACAKCSSEDSSSTVHGKEQALLEETKFWPFTSSEETEPDTKKGEKDDKAGDKKVTKAKANATKQDENTDTEKGEKEDKAEDKKATKVEVNATKQD